MGPPASIPYDSPDIEVRALIGLYRDSSSQVSVLVELLGMGTRMFEAFKNPIQPVSWSSLSSIFKQKFVANFFLRIS